MTHSALLSLPPRSTVQPYSTGTARCSLWYLYMPCPTGGQCTSTYLARGRKHGPQSTPKFSVGTPSGKGLDIQIDIIIDQLRLNYSLPLQFLTPDDTSINQEYEKHNTPPYFSETEGSRRKERSSIPSTRQCQSSMQPTCAGRGPLFAQKKQE